MKIILIMIICSCRNFEDWELKILIAAVWGAKFLTQDNADKLATKLRSMASKSSRNMPSATTPVKLKIKSSNVTTKINIDSFLRAIKMTGN